MTSLKWNLMNKLISKTETDSSLDSRMTAKGAHGKGVEGLNKKEKGLMNVDNSVVIVGGKVI